MEAIDVVFDVEDTTKLIFYQLDSNSLDMVGLVCKSFHKIWSDPAFWKEKARLICDDAVRWKPTYIDHRQQCIDMDNTNVRGDGVTKICIRLFGGSRYLSYRDLIIHGRLDIIIYMRHRWYFIPACYDLNAAACFGHLHILKWAAALHRFSNEDAYSVVAIDSRETAMFGLTEAQVGQAHIDVLKWLLEEKIPITSYIGIEETRFYHINKDGDVEHKRYPFGAVLAVNKINPIEMIEILKPHTVIDYHVLIDYAAGEGNIKLMEYLWNLGHRLTAGLTVACNGGHVNVLDWCAAKDIFPDSDDIAEGIDQPAIIEWAALYGIEPCDDGD